MTARAGQYPIDAYERPAEPLGDHGRAGRPSAVRSTLEQFLAAWGPIESFVDASPSTGQLAGHIASQHPAATVVDLLPQGGRLDGLEGRSFDVVFAHGTLRRQPAPSRTLRRLHGAVAPGGALVFTYPNRFDVPPVSGAGPPADALARAARVEGGGSHLTAARVERLLGSHPRSVWSIVDRPTSHRARQHRPLVFVTA